jgi:hypothetical protein
LVRVPFLKKLLAICLENKWIDIKTKKNTLNYRQCRRTS